MVWWGKGRLTAREHDDACGSSDLAGRVPADYSVGEVYLKLTVIDDVLIVSFKEL